MKEGHGYGLNGNTLKIIAAVSMLIDHIGVVLLPDVGFLRVLGRLAFPIYAYMIAEGCAHTKHRLRYFLTVFLLGAVCQTVYAIASDGTYMGILITFSMSILLVYMLQAVKAAWTANEETVARRILLTALFAAAVAGVYLFTCFVRIDYGFWGCMAPVFASLFRAPRDAEAPLWRKLDCNTVHVLMLGVCLLILACVFGGIRFCALLAVPLLLLYSGKRGTANLKYFFYIFYPAHLVLLEGIAFFLL